MKVTADDYFAQQNLMDYRLVSTLGFTQSDVDAISGRQDVKSLMAGQGLDLIMEHPEGAKVARVMSLANAPTQENPNYLNRLVVESGQLPKNPNQCFVDGQSGYALGDEIRVSAANSQESLDFMQKRTFTVVGLGASPSYISFQRGNAGVGNGQVEYFMYVPQEAFDGEIYTEIYILSESAQGLSAFSGQYQDAIDDNRKILENFGKERAQIRYNEIVGEAQAELDDAKTQLEDAKTQLEDGKKTLADGQKELEDAKEKAKSELAKALLQISDAEKELESGRLALAQGQLGLAEAQTELAQAQTALEQGGQKLQQGQAEYDKGLAKYLEKKAEYDSAKAELELLAQGIDAVPGLLQVLDDLTVGGTAEPLPETQEVFVQTAAALAEVANATAQLLVKDGSAPAALLARQLLDIAQSTNLALQGMQAGGPAILVRQELLPLALLQPEMAGAVAVAKTVLETALPELEAAKTALDGAKAQLDVGWAEFATSQGKISQGYVDLAQGKKQMEEAAAKLNAGQKDLEKGKREYAQKKAEAESEIKKAEEELEKAKAEIADGEKEIADAEKEIADGEKEIAKLEVPKWYVRTRDDSPGYSGFESDTSRIDALAIVIPVFFFFVAALVCLTTMTRMVEEQRTLMGIFKGMGYSSGAIAFKFLLYAGVASTLGSCIGVFLGYIAFPTTIWKAYSIMYIMPEINLWNNLPLAAISVVFSVGCILLATWAACAEQLRLVPAALLRPKAPSPGKRVFFEYIAPLWKRMNFMQKVAARNLFRYKKRFFMTVIGVAGCSALLLSGFGLRDSITGIVDLQYGKVYKYNMMAALTEPSSESVQTELNAVLPNFGTGLYTATLPVQVAGASGAKIAMTVNLYVAQEPQQLEEYIALHPRKSGEVLRFPPADGGVIVTEKLASRLGLGIGSSIAVNKINEDAVELKVSGIAENYILNYIYITPKDYEEAFKSPPEYDTLLIKLNSGQEEKSDDIVNSLLKAKPVAGVLNIAQLKAQFNDMFKSLNAVVWLIIVAAGLLAFVVLYNLTNINITERTREIATLKVLGFYNGEVASYIYRENLILTVIGIVLGLGLGIFLHRFVISTAEIDEVMFRRVIEWPSYLYSAFFTLLSAGLVNLAMLGRLQKINMVESLKSNE